MGEKSLKHCRRWSRAFSKSISDERGSIWSLLHKALRGYVGTVASVDGINDRLWVTLENIRSYELFCVPSGLVSVQKTAPDLVK
jgi:hypothetical protein